jgi:DNA transformation protein and related proteins
MLEAAGITLAAQLRRLGAVAAYRRIKQSCPSASLSLLWGLESAVSRIRWHVVAREHRTSLLPALESHERGVA